MTPEHHPYALTKDLLLVTAGFGSFATWEIYLKHTEELASSLVPILTTLILLFAIYQKFTSNKSDAAESAETVASVVKKAGAIAAVLAAIVALVTFWKRQEQPAPVAALLAPAVRRRSADDESEEPGDGSDVPPAPGSPAWISVANRWVGTAEALPNGRKNPDVCAMFEAVDYYDAATVDCRKVMWCAVFVNFCLTSAGVPGTRSAAARSFSERPRLFEDLKGVPRPGCIVVLSSKDRGPEAGHVGFYAGEAPGNKVRILGGNQGDAVSVAAFPKARVIGYFWPRGVSKSRTLRGTAGVIGGTAVAGGITAYGEFAPDPVTDVAETARNTLETIQGPLEASGHPKALKLATAIGLAVMAITLGLAVYTLWRQLKDHKQGRA